jgi:hypothetical protein
VIARDAVDLETLKKSGKWEELDPAPQVKVWTDDYSSILPLLDFHLR